MKATLAWLAIGSGIVVAATAAAVLTVSHLEERDTFCTSCHTPPEVTYFARAQGARAGEVPYLDLSSAHYGDDPRFHCIDCHRGDGGLLDRAAALVLGARDTVIWVSGNADATTEKLEVVVPFLLNGACIRCHQDAVLVAGFNNHFHNKLPAAFELWKEGGVITQPPDQANLPEEALRIEPSATTVDCVDCHQAHIHVRGSELQGFLDVVNVVYPACARCHMEGGHGPLDLGG